MDNNDVQLSENFKLSEFTSHDNAPTPPEVLENLKELCKNLEVIRSFFGKPIHITSGYRSPEHNKAVGGAKLSQHMLGKAADMQIVSISTIALAAGVRKLITAGKIKQGGVGLYNDWVHYDIRGTEARWDDYKGKH